jgi:16S rRNA (cytidine1402-2'-O)-methyltransferase
MLARDLPAWLAADPHRSRGEFVVVLHATSAAAPTSASSHDTLLAPLLATLPLKQAVALAAEISGAPRNGLYARALELRSRVEREGEPQ